VVFPQIWLLSRYSLAAGQRLAATTCPRLHARQLRLATLNAFSVRNKSAALSAALTDHDLDVFLLTESWHEQQDDLAVRMVCPPGYKSVDAPRSSSAVGRRKQRGGGIVLLHKEGIAAKRLTFSAQPTTFELLGAQMTFAGSMVTHVQCSTDNL